MPRENKVCFLLSFLHIGNDFLNFFKDVWKHGDISSKIGICINFWIRPGAQLRNRPFNANLPKERYQVPKVS